MKHLKQFYTTPEVGFFAVVEEDNFLSPGDFVQGGAGDYGSDPGDINNNDDY